MEEVGLNNQGFKNINKLPPEELIEIYFASDVFCFPTIVESFGNVFLEAMATGLPIVTTDAPGARDIIKNNFNGFVSRVNDKNSILQNIYKIFNNEVNLQIIKENGKKEVEKYNIKKVISAYDSHYKDVILNKKSVK